MSVHTLTHQQIKTLDLVLVTWALPAVAVSKALKGQRSRSQGQKYKHQFLVCNRFSAETVTPKYLITKQTARDTY